MDKIADVGRTGVATCLGLVTLLALGCGSGPRPAYVRLAGEAPRLADVPASRAMLVVFWASWCAPCREETPSLRKLAEAPPRDMAVVVFGHDESAEDVRRFFGGEAPRSWHHRPDPDRTIARSFGVDALPASFVVVDGRLKARFSGPHDWDSRAMRELLERLVAEESAGR